MKNEYKYAQPQIMTNHSAEIAKVLGHKKSKSNFPDLISRKCWAPSPPPAANIETTQNTSRVCVCIKPQGFREFHIPSGKKIKITSTEMDLALLFNYFRTKARKCRSCKSKCKYFYSPKKVPS
jgi:hypothetical protein